MNGHLRDRAVRLIEDPKATQHQKLTVLLAMMLDISDKVEASPLALLSERWRKRVLGFGIGWSFWVTINIFGARISPRDIFEFVKDLL